VVKLLRISLIGLALVAAAHSQVEGNKSPQLNLVAEPQTILLWENGAPGALGTAESDIPTLTIYLALHPAVSHTAVIIFPGGGYGMLASNHEGRQVANWFNALNVTSFVVKYRLGPRYHHPVELEDAQRAIRLVRARAAEFEISPDRIGIMGFSAGGHLVSTAGIHFDGGNASAADPIDRVSCRPDFMILAYPVISFVAPYAHQGSATNLLGENADPKLRAELSSELHVTPQTPPTFVFSTDADTAVPPENAVVFYLALRKAGVPAEMHVFEKGPHGVGLDLDDPVLGQWPTLLANWLRGRGLLQSQK
jgi:acetyl esterase/lipase